MNLFRKNPWRKGGKGTRGQTLLLGLISLIIIVVGILILFDVQRIIRGKTKTMAAVDAAALTGAVWQKHSLNVIGELNLVRACTVLISDPDYGISKDPDTFMKVEKDQDGNITESSLQKARQEYACLQSASDTLSQMQLRVSFAGPLVGFGAAQQAAKNNGLTANENCRKFMEMMMNYVENEKFYTDEEYLTQEYFSFRWREPYLRMLQAVYDSGNGIAVGTNVDLIGLPGLITDPPTSPNFLSYLKSRFILEAIAGRDWCYIQTLLKASYGTKWWGNIQIDQRHKKRITSSEILNLDVDFLPEMPESEYSSSSDYRSQRTTADGLLTDQDPFVRKYKDSSAKTLISSYNSMDPVNADGTPNEEDDPYDLKFNPLPARTWCVFGDEWTPYGNTDEWKTYLRGPFKEGLDYASGAASYFAVHIPVSTLSSKYRFAENFRFGNQNSFSSRLNSYAESADAGQRSTASITSISFDATAKPLGYLETEQGKKYYPFYARMILPVFDKVAMVPVSLECPDGSPMYDYAWVIYVTKFLPGVGQVTSIDAASAFMDAEEWAMIQKWVDCWHLLEDPDFRERGIQWLNTEIAGHDVHNDDGLFLYHVTDRINADNCFVWSSGGSGGAPRQGPGKLH